MCAMCSTGAWHIISHTYMYMYMNVCMYMYYEGSLGPFSVVLQHATSSNVSINTALHTLQRAKFTCTYTCKTMHHIHVHVINNTFFWGELCCTTATLFLQRFVQLGKLIDSDTVNFQTPNSLITATALKCPLINPPPWSQLNNKPYIHVGVTLAKVQTQVLGSPSHSL